jgi:hypothetical protein
MNKDIDHNCTDNPVCPYCGHDQGDQCEGPPSGQVQCYECSKYFECEPEFSVTYSTSQVACWNGEPHNWGKTFVYGAEGLRNCKMCQKSEWVDVPKNKEIAE